MIKICLAGFGKMNRQVYEACLQDRELKVVSILEPNPEEIDGIATTANAAQAFQLAEVVIDFSTKEACSQNAVTAAKMQKNIVIGTTGLSAEEVEEIRRAVKENKTSGVISANFSIGVNAFIETARQLQDKLKGYELEMVEVHHKAKKDSPSGTALRTLTALGRTKENTPVHCLRMGDVIGDHSIIFAGNSERIELTHRATSRKCFAQGAILSAKWVSGKSGGTLHDFRDVIS